MDWDQTFVVDGGQDDKKMGADVKAGARKASGRADRSPGERSITAAADRVEHAGGVVITVGTIGCSAFGPQRCEFGGPK